MRFGFLNSKLLLKTITWRIVASTISFILFFIFTKEYHIAIMFSITEITSKMIAYYIHELFWKKD